MLKHFILGIFLLVYSIKGYAYEQTLSDINTKAMCTVLENGGTMKDIMTDTNLQITFVSILGVAEGMLRIARDNPNVLQQHYINKTDKFISACCSGALIMHEPMEKQIGHKIGFREVLLGAFSLAISKH